MKDFERIIYIVIMLAMFVFYQSRPSKTIVKTEVIPGDSIAYEVEIPYDSLIFIIDTVKEHEIRWLHDTAFLPTDTAAILADYMKLISYDSINLRNDTSIINWVSIDVTQNRIKNIKGFSLNKRATSIIHTYEYKFGVGAIVGIDLVAPTISYRHKQHQFGLGYNVLNPSPILTYQYKFNLK